MAEQKKKIGIIVQRYGAQVNGGAEVHARMIAEKLSLKYDVTVLTSRALDYHTWQPELPAGESLESGIRTIRFDHPPKANPRLIHHFNRKTRGRLWYQKLYRLLKKPGWYLHLFPDSEIREADENQWLQFQGPTMPMLIKYLIEQADRYSAYIFFTYLYHPTAVGMPNVGHKSILIPTMHDEPPAYLPIFKKVMAAPRSILFNTAAEQRFSEALFPIANSFKQIAAVGIETPSPPKSETLIRGKFKIEEKYILYAGRIDFAKGCAEMLAAFLGYLKTHKGCRLVLAGKNMIPETVHSQITYCGFVSDNDLSELMYHAQALIIPSKYESLSLVLLEAFIRKTPVIVNGSCEVLVDHVNGSQAGWAYTDFRTFEIALDAAISGGFKALKGLNGFNYVRCHYTWPHVMEVYDKAIAFVESQNLSS